MTAWHSAPNGEERYTLSLPHRELTMVYRALDAQVRRAEQLIADLAEDRPRGARTTGEPWAADLAASYLRLQYLRDRFDPAKVRSDWLRTHDGPGPWPPEPP